MKNDEFYNWYYVYKQIISISVIGWTAWHTIRIQTCQLEKQQIELLNLGSWLNNFKFSTLKERDQSRK